MKTMCVLFSVLFLSLLSACRQVPHPAAPATMPAAFPSASMAAARSPTSNPAAATLATSETQPTPTQEATPLTATAVALPTPTSQPAPSAAPLVPPDLVEITLDTIPNLAVFAEIPYPQIEPNHNIFYLALSGDGSKLVVISENWQDRTRALWVWDLVTNSPLLAIQNPPYRLWRAYFSPDDRQLWVLRDTSIERYDLAQGSLVDSITVPAHDVALVSPDGSTLVTGTYQGSTDSSTIQFYHFGEDHPFFSDELPYMITHFAFSADSRVVAGFTSRIGASLIQVWDLQTGARLKDLHDYLAGPVFSSDSKLVALVKDERLSVFSLDGWVLQSSFPVTGPDSPEIPRLFLGDDQLLAFADSYDVSFREVRTGRELLGLPGACSLGYAPSLNYVVTFCSNGHIKLWGVLP